MKKGKLNCKCLICGKKFHLKLSAIKRGRGKYCSKKCFSEYRRRDWLKKENNPMYLGVDFRLEKNPNWKNAMPYCLDCGKRLNNYRAKRHFECWKKHWKYSYLRYYRQRTKYKFKYKAGDLSLKTIQQVYEDNIKKFGTLTCYLCLKPIEFGEDNLEHKIPLSRGGTNEYNNLAISCRRCNYQKKTKTEQEFKEVMSYVPTE